MKLTHYLIFHCPKASEALILNIMQPTQNPVAQTPGEDACPEHGRKPKWVCAVCGKPLCPACKPIAYQYKVFHRECIEKYNQMPEKKRVPLPVATDAPSTGVRVVAWCFVVSAVFWLGIGLLASGVVLASLHFVPLNASLGNPLAALDEIPGSREILTWLAAAGLAGAAVQTWIGLGLLNCIPSARRVVLFFAWLQVLVAMLGWAVVLISQQGFWDIPLIAVILIVYFSRRDVKKQFQPGIAAGDTGAGARH